ncbi:MAG: hypothetical protein AUI16_23780 [Alphaproteobacteria bacterium 13_2_20CM_2_64_7]|nr:MAG: hypothetical protein AUI16_23780 [Alphaproteobacteria bacterium 13_2_20CM_2_64_7]
MTASEHQPLDPRLMLLARAAARLTLFESGELDLDGACEGLIDMDWTFWRACDIAKQAVRDRGVAALDESATRERLARCDAKALKAIDRWLIDFEREGFDQCSSSTPSSPS